MAVERKCGNCGTWNTNNDHCFNCQELLSPKLIEEKREEEREHRRLNKPLNGLDIFIERWKNNRFWVLRVLYKIVYTISVIFLSIAAFFAYLAASPNG